MSLPLSLFDTFLQPHWLMDAVDYAKLVSISGSLQILFFLPGVLFIFTYTWLTSWYLLLKGQLIGEAFPDTPCKIATLFLESILLICFMFFPQHV